MRKLRNLPHRRSGLSRSLDLYYRDATHNASLAALYARFVRHGDLVFDIGAHVGDRIAAFRSLGCRVIAVEPQPRVFRLLRLLYSRDTEVTLVQAAIAEARGTIRLHINSANPTVSTASEAFIAAAQTGASGWEGQHWDSAVEVNALTLDDLIAAHGQPAFIKVDVEGLEDRVLAGLSSPVPALSFEFTTLQRDVALRALERLQTLGGYRFNASLGETHTLLFDESQSAEAIQAWLARLPHDANSGDIYAAAC